MSIYQAHEIDPESIHLNQDIPIRDNLEGLIQVAKLKARKEGSYIMISHGFDANGDESIHFKGMTPEEFEKGYIWCPQQADLTYQEQNKKPRPFPSILVTPQGEVIVSKSSLCDGCVHRLRRSVFGCVSVHFEPLTGS